MITEIDFSQESMNPGDERILRAWATTPLSIAIECFRQPPSPPQLRSCPECGEFPIGNGDPVPIKISAEVFREKAGFLQITLRDREDTRVIRLKVKPKEQDRYQTAYA